MIARITDRGTFKFEAIWMLALFGFIIAATTVSMLLFPVIEGRFWIINVATVIFDAGFLAVAIFLMVRGWRKLRTGSNSAAEGDGAKQRP